MLRVLHGYQPRRYDETCTLHRRNGARCTIVLPSLLYTVAVYLVPILGPGQTEPILSRATIDSPAIIIMIGFPVVLGAGLLAFFPSFFPPRPPSNPPRSFFLSSFPFLHLFSSLLLFPPSTLHFQRSRTIARLSSDFATHEKRTRSSREAGYVERGKFSKIRGKIRKGRKEEGEGGGSVERERERAKGNKKEQAARHFSLDRGAATV